MTVYLITTIQHFIGLEDERPETTVGLPVGSRMLEVDTGAEFMYIGDYYATGVLTVTEIPDVDDEIDISSMNYVFVAADPSPGEIAQGASVAEAVANIVAAINGTDEVNAANADVTAAADGSTVVLTAVALGTDGNAVTTVYTATDMVASSFADATLVGAYGPWEALS